MRVSSQYKQCQCEVAHSMPLAMELSNIFMMVSLGLSIVGQVDFFYLFYLKFNSFLVRLGVAKLKVEHSISKTIILDWVSYGWANIADGSSFLEFSPLQFPIKELLSPLKERLTATLILGGGSLAQSLATGDSFQM